MQQGTYRYDAFMSYASVDRPLVRRVQRFLESYRLRLSSGKRRRVKVYLDATDIRGGSLPTELGDALTSSRVLLLCCSTASTTSQWMRFEIQRYVRGRENPVIAPLLLAGEPEATLLPQLRAIPELKGAEPRVHDLRNGWRFGLLRRRAKEELLRLLAMLTDVDLRTLRNWRARRTLMFASGWVVGLLGVPAAYLALPVDDWEPMQLRLANRQPLEPIACGFRDNELWAASRFVELASDRPRNYIRVTSGVLTSRPKDSFEQRLLVRERLLPLRIVDFNLVQRAKAAFGPGLWAQLEDRSMEPSPPQTWLGEPSKGRFIAVHKLPATDEQLEAEREFRADYLLARHLPTRALVAVYDGRAARSAVVDALSPDWPAKKTAFDDPPSPSQGIAVAWDDAIGLWLGVAGRADGESGGLWHSTDGANWTRVRNFSSVRSIAVPQHPARSVLVSERAFDRFVFVGKREPYPSRVLEADPSGHSWSKARMPPYGTSSDVEMCGLDTSGHLIVRVDGRMFGHRKIPRLRALLAQHTGSRVPIQGQVPSVSPTESLRRSVALLCEPWQGSWRARRGPGTGPASDGQGRGGSGGRGRAVMLLTRTHGAPKCGR